MPEVLAGHSIEAVINWARSLHRLPHELTLKQMILARLLDNGALEVAYTGAARDTVRASFRLSSSLGPQFICEHKSVLGAVEAMAEKLADYVKNAD